MNNQYSTIFLGMTYVSLRSKYFALYTSTYFNPEHFEVLSKFLEKEQVDPYKYFDYIFGILEYKKPLTPAKMADPVLLERFRQMVR